MHLRLTKYLKPPIDLYWWRLHGDQPKGGNFGDEITKEIVETVFNRRVQWSPVEHCQIIGAGSIIEEVTENKGSNKPYLWGSGFIQTGDLTISQADYTIIGVRGKSSLARIKGVDSSDVVLGDPGLLASRLLEKRPKKQYSLGILPHYVDLDHPFVTEMANQGSQVRIINPLWPCREVVEEVAKCETLLSSSMHGLIVADSLSIPNLHIKLSDGLKGGTYKFNDYYSIYSSPRYQQVTPADLHGLDYSGIQNFITGRYVTIPAPELDTITQRLITSFPF